MTQQTKVCENLNQPDVREDKGGGDEYPKEKRQQEKKRTELSPGLESDEKPEESGEVDQTGKGRQSEKSA